MTEFRPVDLKSLRNSFIEKGWSRSTINKVIQRIIRAFQWAVSESLIKPDILLGLKSIGGLKKGRSAALEPRPIRPVPEEDVHALRPFLSDTIMAMIEVQQL